MYVFDLAVDNHFFELQKRAHPHKVVGAKFNKQYYKTEFFFDNVYLDEFSKNSIVGRHSPRIFDRINAPGLSPPGKQNGIFPGNLYLIYRSVMNAHLNLQKLFAN